MLDIIEAEKLNERAEIIGQTIKTKMKDLANTFEQIGDIRGLGAMVAVEIVNGAEDQTPNKAAVSQIVAEANKRGLFC